MIVREAQRQDAAEVAGVCVRSWQVAYRGLFGDDYLDGLRAEDRMAQYIFGAARPDGPCTLVAVVDATLCGFVSTGPSRADRWQPDGHLRQEDVWGVLADEVRYHRSLPGPRRFFCCYRCTRTCRESRVSIHE